MKYLKVDKSIEQVIKTSAFLAKVKGEDKKIINMLEKEYEKDKSNLNNVAAVCFYTWFLADDKLDLADTNSVFQVTFNVLNKLDDVLEMKPEYWILWILKYKIQSFNNINEFVLIEDLKALSKNQDENEKEPYYLVTDVLLAHIYYITDKQESAKEVLELVLSRYNSKIDILQNFFRGYVIEFKNVVARSGDTDIMELLVKIINDYF